MAFDVPVACRCTADVVCAVAFAHECMHKCKADCTSRGRGGWGGTNEGVVPVRVPVRVPVPVPVPVPMPVVALLLAVFVAFRAPGSLPPYDFHEFGPLMGAGDSGSAAMPVVSGHLGASLGLLEPSWGHLGPCWRFLGQLGVISGLSWAILRLPWAVLGSSSGPLRLGAIWQAPGAVLGRSWPEMARN